MMTWMRFVTQMRVPYLGKVLCPNWRETFQTPRNSSCIFLFDMNIKYIIARLHILIIFSILAKFQENQNSIDMSSFRYLNFKFLWSKIMHKK